MADKMGKYLARLVFQVTLPGADGVEFDEQLRLIESASMEGAYYKARQIGKREEEVIVTNGDTTIKWTFVDVKEIFTLDDHTPGALIYSTTRRQDDVPGYIAYVRKKAMEIQVKSLTFA